MKTFVVTIALCISSLVIAAAGDTCDPAAVTPPCGPNLTCSDTCGPGLTCSDVNNTCGTPCGNGTTVCEDIPGDVCMDDAAFGEDCAPACLDANNQPMYRTITKGTCETHGLLGVADGRCFVPCWYDICGLLGGQTC